MRNLTRRSVLAAVGVAATLPASALLGAAGSRPPARRPAPDYAFFDAAEARFIEAACERLLPADASVPGALAAGVPRYLDYHLAGAWGAGERLYRHGPWQPGTPAHGGRTPVAPAVLFRRALCAVRRDVQQRGAPSGTPFERWTAADQDRYLRLLAAGALHLDAVPSTVFFQMLLGMTVEGFFSDPRFAGTRDRVSWPMHGFPGAHAHVS
ncbi:MAG: gluconate 2-dehydrogenase subunit 3 family protein [Steroidobacteraceae bacterium]